jgi:hypothetical protein
MIVLCGLIIGILFLEETHAEKKYRHDPGLMVGRWILGKVRRCAIPTTSRREKVAHISETQSLIDVDDDRLPGYQTTEGSPHMPSTPSTEPREPLRLDGFDDAFDAPRHKPAIAKAFTHQVVLNIIGYGILA